MNSGEAAHRPRAAFFLEDFWFRHNLLNRSCRSNQMRL